VVDEVKEALETAYYGPAFYGSLWQLLDFEAEVAPPFLAESRCIRVLPRLVNLSHPSALIVLRTSNILPGSQRRVVFRV
jgi:hypothetical protein